MKKLISLCLLLALVLCLAACNDNTNVLDTLMDVRYRGDAERLTRLAPQKYWDWYEAQGRSIDELIAYSQGAYNSYLNVMTSRYGIDMEVTHSVIGEKAMDAELQTKIADALERQYGITGTTNGRVVTVSLTITGTLLSETTEEEFLMVQIDGKDYFVTVTEEDDAFTVNFRM